MPLSPIGSTGSQTQLPSLVNAQDSVAKRVADCGCRALASSNPPSFIQKHSFTIIALCVVAIVAAAAFAIKFFLDRRTLLADLDAEKRNLTLRSRNLKRT
jgi:hypothetical protein